MLFNHHLLIFFHHHFFIPPPPPPTHTHTTITTTTTTTNSVLSFCNVADISPGAFEGLSNLNNLYVFRGIMVNM